MSGKKIKSFAKLGKRVGQSWLLKSMLIGEGVLKAKKGQFCAIYSDC
jgi:hypothetical protein